MDKNQQEVLNGLFHSIEDLKARLQALESQVAAFATEAVKGEIPEQVRNDEVEVQPAPLSYRAERSEASASPTPDPIPDDTPMDWSDTEIGVVDLDVPIPVPSPEPEPTPLEEEIPEQVRNDEAEVLDDEAEVLDDNAEVQPDTLSYRAERSEASVSPAPAPAPAPAPEPAEVPAEAPIEATAPVKGKSLADLAAERLAWKTDFPGISVKNIRSAISLVDRAQFIAKLFNEDFALYDKTISELNDLTTLDEAVQYVTGHFPDWNLSSDLVYSFMMAIRKKLG